jgi:predicted metallo-beta-lactamase superfamily hydrolase
MLSSLQQQFLMILLYLQAIRTLLPFQILKLLILLIGSSMTRHRHHPPPQKPELRAQTAASEIPAAIRHNVLAININKTYGLKTDFHPNIYEATRKSWKVNIWRTKKIDYVLSEP